MRQDNSSTIKSIRKTQKKLPLLKAKSSKKAVVVKAKRKVSIFDLLKRDHTEIQKLCKKVLEGKVSTSEQIHDTFNSLKGIVLSHNKAVGSIFYNEVLEASQAKQDLKGHQRVLKGFEEHRIAGMLINEMSQIGVEDERFMAKMNVLSETLLNNIKNEELSIFKTARKVLDNEVRGKLAKQFVQEKKKNVSH